MNIRPGCLRQGSASFFCQSGVNFYEQQAGIQAGPTDDGRLGGEEVATDGDVQIVELSLFSGTVSFKRELLVSC